MADLNRVLLLGNLTRDPEIRYTPKGTPVGDLSLAVNTTIRSQDGQTRDEVCFVEVVAWGRQAETCKQYLHKGSLVLVEGRLQWEQWEGKDGEKRSRLRVRADRIQFLGRGRVTPETPTGSASLASPIASEEEISSPTAPPLAGTEEEPSEDPLPF
ncbi:single-stranded DNA-binding protein [Candidatus Methylacidithermus pantelleriae]|uniref:Single-stranded DNA-binding protein n=1 Tax=Candidatus Methylacidithermus pantelleriae TaxID=2744239 RepID=A0A8J2BQE9_9BACT|nr:single-stranded DNA-binding protein [Candidatus Methylacidithermus pantelleriae]CAF0701791.1 Single-stranded DNA-binding protein [Candidatus Methylacidithermus pantelleriae]